jgi:hypothetical protein
MLSTWNTAGCPDEHQMHLIVYHSVFCLKRRKAVLLI